MIREYRPGDLWVVLPTIRQSELDEARALGEDPEASIKHAVYSGETVTLEIDGEIVGLAGMVPHVIFNVESGSTKTSELDYEDEMQIGKSGNASRGLFTTVTGKMVIQDVPFSDARAYKRVEILVPWSVFTTAIDKHPIRFLKECKTWISRYDMPMMNVVDERNKKTQKWLKWLGFTLSEPEPFGINGEPFRYYWRGM